MMKKLKVNNVLDELRKVMERPIGVTLLYDNDSEFVVQSVEGLQMPPPQDVEAPASEPPRTKEE